MLTVSCSHQESSRNSINHPSTICVKINYSKFCRLWIFFIHVDSLNNCLSNDCLKLLWHWKNTFITFNYCSVLVIMWLRFRCFTIGRCLQVVSHKHVIAICALCSSFVTSKDNEKARSKIAISSPVIFHLTTAGDSLSNRNQYNIICLSQSHVVLVDDCTA